MTEGNEPRIKILEFLLKMGLKGCVWLLIILQRLNVFYKTNFTKYFYYLNLVNLRLAINNLIVSCNINNQWQI